MIDKISWYFEISEKAGWVKDEDGNNAPCYCEYKLGFKRPVDETEIKTNYDEQAKSASHEVAKNLKIPVEYVKVITKEEYLSNTENDEDLEDDYFDEDEYFDDED